MPGKAKITFLQVRGPNLLQERLSLWNERQVMKHCCILPSATWYQCVSAGHPATPILSRALPYAVINLHFSVYVASLHSSSSSQTGCVSLPAGHAVVEPPVPHARGVAGRTRAGGGSTRFVFMGQWQSSPSSVLASRARVPFLYSRFGLIKARNVFL